MLSLPSFSSGESASQRGVDEIVIYLLWNWIFNSFPWTLRMDVRANKIYYVLLMSATSSRQVQNYHNV